MAWALINMSARSNDGELNFDAEAEISWRSYIGDFNENVWPFFREMGYTKDTALLAWMLNKQYNLTCELIDTVEHNLGTTE